MDSFFQCVCELISLFSPLFFISVNCVIGRTMSVKRIRMAAVTLRPTYLSFLFYLYISYCFCLPSSHDHTLASVTSRPPSGSLRRLPVEEGKYAYCTRDIFFWYLYSRCCIYVAVEALNAIARKLKITHWPQLQPNAPNHCDALQKWNFYNTTASTPTLRNFTCGSCDPNNTCHITYMYVLAFQSSSAKWAIVLMFFVIVFATNNQTKKIAQDPELGWCSSIRICQSQITASNVRQIQIPTFFVSMIVFLTPHFIVDCLK